MTDTCVACDRRAVVVRLHGGRRLPVCQFHASDNPTMLRRTR